MRVTLSEAMLGDLVSVLTPVVVAEAQRMVAAQPESPERRAQRAAEAEIMAACKAVAAASDALAQAQLSGAAEIPARRKLEKAANQLALTMRRHGRYTGLLGI